MEIDIRGSGESEITAIKYAEGEYVKLSDDGIIEIDIGHPRSVEIWQYDIDNLIKALQKAKELWT